MVLKIDFDSEEALYTQLCNQIICGIAMDVLHDGDSLPSVRQLADEIGINMHTVNKAYAVLKQEGFLRLDRRRGAVIALDMDKLRTMIRMKYVAPTDILTCSVGFVNCGTVRNIIPDELTFGGTIRTFNVDGAGTPFVKQLMDVVEKECELCQCTYEILHMPDPLFECQNNAVCSEIAKNAVRKYIGEDAVTVAQPWMASESMQACLKLWPGIITFTGIQSEEAGTGANHHTPEFDVDERGMIYGVAAALGYVKDFLNYDKEIPFKPFEGTLKNLVERNL